MSATVLERDMLKTRVPERAMDVTTYLHEDRHDPPGHPWTGVWAHQEGRPESISLVWLHFWRGPTTPGGLDEAHAHIVAQVQRGEIPAQAQDHMPYAERQTPAKEGADYA